MRNKDDNALRGFKEWSPAEIEVLKAKLRGYDGRTVNLSRELAPSMHRTEAALNAKICELRQQIRAGKDIPIPKVKPLTSPVETVANILLPSEQRAFIKGQREIEKERLLNEAEIRKQRIENEGKVMPTPVSVDELVDKAVESVKVENSQPELKKVERDLNYAIFEFGAFAWAGVPKKVVLKRNHFRIYF